MGAEKHDGERRVIKLQDASLFISDAATTKPRLGGYCIRCGRNEPELELMRTRSKVTQRANMPGVLAVMVYNCSSCATVYEFRFWVPARLLSHGEGSDG